MEKGLVLRWEPEPAGEQAGEQKGCAPVPVPVPAPVPVAGEFALAVNPWSFFFFFPFSFLVLPPLYFQCRVPKHRALNGAGRLR
jgi:hypothetical protein